MKGITFDKFPIHHRCGLLLCEVELIDAIDLHGGRWEIVVIIKRTVEIALVILFDVFGELGFVCALDDEGEDRADNQASEAH